ncbi:unnamed protein product [marine sediment metagenome]|uniref:Uncharacterized protein n=1 Tax=marine sediment metagenome TaxID=412755 RepID=X0WJ91_9ZZZZ
MDRVSLIRAIKKDANLPKKNDDKAFFTKEQLLQLSLLLKKLIVGINR